MKIPGLGQVLLWPGGHLWIGHSNRPTALHAHHAIQICCGLSGDIRLRPADDAPWTPYQAAFIPARLPHAFDAVGVDSAVLLCEPESELGRRLSTRFPAGQISPLPQDIAERLTALFHPTDADSDDTTDLTTRSRAALNLVAGRPDWRTVPVADPRILRATATLKERTDQPVTLEEIAATVHLSPGRFRHLFVAETGLPFRRYLLWLRLQKALSVALSGEKWAQAAQAAGFADQAHLSRTFRQMFGIAPTFLNPPDSPAPPDNRLDRRPKQHPDHRTGA